MKSVLLMMKNGTAIASVGISICSKIRLWLLSFICPNIKLISCLNFSVPPLIFKFKMCTNSVRFDTTRPGGYRFISFSACQHRVLNKIWYFRFDWTWFLSICPLQHPSSDQPGKNICTKHKQINYCHSLKVQIEKKIWK